MTRSEWDERNGRWLVHTSEGDMTCHVLVSAIDVASDDVETPEQVADVIGGAMKYVAKDRIIPCTNCGMAPMRREIANAKLVALGRGAELARQRFA